MSEDCEYRWTSSGEACGTCQSMAGTYATPPGPPHPSCQCVVVPVPPPEDLPPSELFDFSVTVRGDAHGTQEVRIEVTLTIECPEEGAVEETFVFTTTVEGDSESAMEWAEDFGVAWVDHVYEQAAQGCATLQCIAP